MKRSFFQAAVASILLYGCTTWTLTKRLEKKLDGNYTRILRAILNKSRRQHPTRHQLYGHLPPITETIQVRQSRHAAHCWRSREELISDVLLWTPTYGQTKAARTYIQQLCEDTGCSSEYLPGAMNDREKWRERVRDIRATSTTWWWSSSWSWSNCQRVISDYGHTDTSAAKIRILYVWCHMISLLVTITIHFLLRKYDCLLLDWVIRKKILKYFDHIYYLTTFWPQNRAFKCVKAKFDLILNKDIYSDFFSK